ncbi:hypothetical protein NHQ30_006433 [Ciborinia camelliae]|nr:hypothetical protein NHQ30_006433 [Ciborinia camelliae]
MDTKECTSEDIEATNICVNRGEKRDCVNAISNTTEGQTNLDTQFIDEGSTEESKNCKGRIKSGVLGNIILAKEFVTTKIPNSRSGNLKNYRKSRETIFDL